MTKLQQLKKKLAAVEKQQSALGKKIDAAEVQVEKWEHQYDDLDITHDAVEDEIADLEDKEKVDPLRAAAKIIDSSILTISLQLQGRGTPTVVDTKRAEAVRVVLNWAVKELLSK